MNNKPILSGNIFISSLLSTIKYAAKFTIISSAWLLKFAGMTLSKCGETIEAIIVKSHR